MIRQEFSLDRWGWNVVVFYESVIGDAEEISCALRNAGCNGSGLAKACDTLMRGESNFGITYSNYHSRKSIIVIGSTCSAFEFAKSFDHEKRNLCKQMIQKLFIDPYCEEADRIAEEILEKTYPYARKYLCNHHGKFLGAS